MGILEIEKLTCGDCIWGNQCPAETICEYFDSITEYEPCWGDEEDFASVYSNYIKKRLCPCTDETYFPLFTGLPRRFIQGVI